jgi:hypothetical protein
MLTGRKKKLVSYVTSIWYFKVYITILLHLLNKGMYFIVGKIFTKLYLKKVRTLHFIYKKTK